MSSVKRDMARMEKYQKEKKFQETWKPKETSTPMKEIALPGLACSIVESIPPVEKQQDLEKDESIEKETKQSDQNRESKEQLKDEPFFKSKEEIEILRKVIIDECRRSFEGTTNELKVARMNEEKSPDNVNEDNNDCVEEAKLWAMRQKQSFVND